MPPRKVQGRGGRATSSRLRNGPSKNQSSIPKKIPKGSFLLKGNPKADMRVDRMDKVVKLNSTEQLPSDLQLTHGTLDNGFTYYIRPCGTDNGVVEMRLVVNVGSICEGQKESGFAHFIEHMAFRGTKTHSRKRIKELLKKNLDEIFG